MQICKNKGVAFTEMEIIQFHLLVKTFAEILINSKRRKNGKPVEMWLREQLFISLE